MSNIAVNVAVLKDGQILLTRREDFEVWCMPSGAVDDGESVAQAAIRETLEEIGIEVELTRLVGVYSRTGVLPDLHVILFAAQPVGGELRTQPGETIEVRYFPYDQIPGEMLYGMRSRIEDAIAGVGGGIAAAQVFHSDKELTLTRKALYGMRDQSGLPRQEFYQNIMSCIELHENIEVGRRSATGENR
jgi:ADP-ribose pyrophosphatase YjhB (NUDIX family)